MTISLIAIPPQHVAEVWSLGHKFIEQGTSYGEVTPDELMQDCITGRTQLWYAWSDRCEGALVTRILDTPAGDVCYLEAFGAETLDRVLPLLAEVGKWAKSINCVALRIYGRKGWARRMRDFTLRWICLEKRLTP